MALLWTLVWALEKGTPFDPLYALYNFRAHTSEPLKRHGRPIRLCYGVLLL